INQDPHRTGSFKIPATFSKGNYLMILVVDPHNQVHETNEDNNVDIVMVEIQSSDKTVSAGPLKEIKSDIIMDQVSLSRYDATLGNSLIVSFQVTNQGQNRVAEANYKIVVLHYSPINPSDFDDANSILFVGKLWNLDPGASYSVAKTITLPINMVVTGHDSIAVAVNYPEPWNYWGGTRQKYIIKHITLHYGRRPDFAVIRFEINPNPPESFINLKVSIKNVGSCDSLPCTYRIIGLAEVPKVRWYDADDRHEWTWVTCYNSRHDLSPVLPGQTKHSTFEIEKTPGTRSLNFHILVDDGHIIVEADESNNSKRFIINNL
ncbi:MAG: hypothetical protein MUP22_06820, partial [Desulfobacterales bacterium]|nr:hypothetical protein [Desulfobacterales bacterium]